MTMLLTEHNICYYLLEKGMIDLPAIVLGKFTARRSDSRNNNFIINKEYDNHKYFIKQVKAKDTEKIETLGVEANCYQLAATDAQYKALKDYLPKFYYFDPHSYVLIIEQVKDAFSVRDYYFQMPDFKNNLPQLMADSLASYHKVINPQVQQPGFPFFRQQKPWIFTVATSPPLLLAEASPSVEQQIIQLIFKNTEFVQLLALVEKEWLPQSLVHNDVKFDNFLLNYDFENNKINTIKQIDWELADLGDPLWDVAAIFQNYLFLWISTDVPVQQNFKKIGLEEVQPCIDQFWKRYVQQMKLQPNQQSSLIKAVKYVAFKLIHACFEMAPAASTLQPMSVKMLQMSFNILRSPENAAIYLFGIK
jgi:hypothetical protein